jgi:hypothetical protein
MYEIAEAAQPITGRGIGYKLFTRGLIPSMSRNDMQKVYRLLKEAREEDIIPWEWIVDESRGIERIQTWDNPEQYARAVAYSYRRDFWNQQDVRVQVWSEKGTVRGVLKPVLEEYQVGFNAVHGYNSATNVHEVAGDDNKELVVLYVGDYDPSGMHMSEEDLPNRLEEYGGWHIEMRRIALTREQVRALPSFPASDKRKDTRYSWFVSNYGHECWELDAMDPNDLRDCVEEAIQNLIEWDKWERCKRVNQAEEESMRTILQGWHSLDREEDD